MNGSSFDLRDRIALRGGDNAHAAAVLTMRPPDSRRAIYTDLGRPETSQIRTYLTALGPATAPSGIVRD